jgi:F0F1-type ATP synthase epsilon subunit
LQVDLVLIPAVTGDFGAMPGHVPTVAQLRPGVVTVHKELDKDVKKYFVRCAGKSQERLLQIPECWGNGQ